MKIENFVCLKAQAGFDARSIRITLATSQPGTMHRFGFEILYYFGSFTIKDHLGTSNIGFTSHQIAICLLLIANCPLQIAYCQLNHYLSAMEIHYRSKDESNRAQREAFLKLTPTERFYAFLELSERMKDFPVKNPPKLKDKGNFVIVIHSNDQDLAKED